LSDFVAAQRKKWKVFIGSAGDIGGAERDARFES
jgi:hypothetical protein